MDTFPDITIKNYAQLRHEIKSGDIFLCSGNSTLSNLIQQTTKSVWSHVGFILRLDMIDRIMILESVESIGVRAVTLSSYINDYNGTGKAYPGSLMIARHRDLKQENIKQLSKFATDLLGHPYNTQQILRIAARLSLGSIGITNQTRDEPQREFICSEYAYKCFQSVGVTVDFDPLGFITPADFARCSKITPISFIETQEMKLSVSNRNIPVSEIAV